MSDVQRFWVQRGALYPDDAEREHHRRTNKLQIVEADAYDALAHEVEKYKAGMKEAMDMLEKQALGFTALVDEKERQLAEARQRLAATEEALQVRIGLCAELEARLYDLAKPCILDGCQFERMR